MTENELILAIDQGTTGSTCLIVDPSLRVHGRANVEFPQHFPRPGWVEHDPEELWSSVLHAITGALAQTNVSSTRIAAVGVANQRETSLIWDRTSGQAVHRAIVWQDRRTAEHCAKLRASGVADRIRTLTGLVVDPYFSGTKLSWVLDHVDPNRTQARSGRWAAGTIDTYLLWRLTGGKVHATEPSNACRTMLWPLEGDQWSAELCEQLHVPVELLPEVHPTAHRFGTTQGVPGLPDGIPITGIAGDQQAALFGQACFEPGEAKCTYGTGAFVVMNTGMRPTKSSHGLLTSVAWRLGENTTYCLEGSAFMAGGVVQWLRDALGFFDCAAEVEALAAKVEHSDGVVLVPAHAGLGAPHWRPDARGLLFGMTRGTTRAHIARAALEGVALQINDLLDAMAADLQTPLTTLRVDGGAAANNLLMQLQADVLGCPLARPTLLEATALGAVALAGRGVGLYPDHATVRAAWAQDRRFEPQAAPARIATLKQAWARAVEIC